jgi:hypothetical protein
MSAYCLGQIIEGMSYADYELAPGIRSGHLAGPTPAHWRARKVADTKALRFGRLLHDHVLEGKLTVIPKPKGMSFATTEGKLWRASAKTRGEIVDADEFASLSGIHESVHALEHNGKQYLQQALLGGRKELTCFAIDPATGLKLKCRLDLLPPDDLFKDGLPIIDFKSCMCAAADAFDREILKRGYFRQLDFYRHVAQLCGINITRAYLVACEKQPPYAVRVVDLNDEWLELGRLQNRKRLAQWRDCELTGNWPAYSSEPDLSTPPPWLSAQLKHAPGTVGAMFNEQPDNEPESEMEAIH